MIWYFQQVVSLHLIKIILPTLHSAHGLEHIITYPSTLLLTLAVIHNLYALLAIHFYTTLKYI